MKETISDLLAGIGILLFIFAVWGTIWLVFVAVPKAWTGPPEACREEIFLFPVSDRHTYRACSEPGHTLERLEWNNPASPSERLYLCRCPAPEVPELPAEVEGPYPWSPLEAVED